MSDKLPMPRELEVECEAEAERQIDAFKRLVTRWPNFRKHIAYAFLGPVIANVDMMGGDAEGFLAKVRRQFPRPTPIEPGQRSAS